MSSTSQRVGEQADLARLLGRRWNIAALAELGRSDGAKFITLVNRLGISRASLTAALKDLVRLGLVRRNRGYGHPLRPEYLLTDEGRRLAQPCRALFDAIGDEAARRIAFRKWSLPLVAAIGTRAVRFSDLKSALAGVTPRALVLALKALEEIGWVERDVSDDYPPATRYRLASAGDRIRRYLVALSAAAASSL